MPRTTFRPPDYSRNPIEVVAADVERMRTPRRASHLRQMSQDLPALMTEVRALVRSEQSGNQQRGYRLLCEMYLCAAVWRTHDDRIGQRLHKIGIRPRQDRSTALFTLAAELSDAILARVLGGHIQVAVQWQNASAGDWAAYAADVSRSVPENQ